MNFYNELFDKLNESDVIEFLSLSVKLNNGVWKGNCPSNHPSTSGESFQINNKQFHCWNCGVGGNLVHLIEFIKFGTTSKKKMTDNYRQARDIACDIAGMNRIFSSNLSAEELKQIEEEQAEREIFSSILTRANDLMNTHLLDSFKGEIYKEIELDRKEIELFKIGFCYSTLLTDLKKEFEMEEIESTGLVERIGKRHELTLGKRYIFPFIRNQRVMYMSGRVPYSDKANKAKYKKLSMHDETERPYISRYLKNDVFFNEDILKGAKEIIITEGLTDCIKAVSNGIPAMASSSVSTREDVFKQVIDLLKNIHDVYLCYDVEKSEAGQKSAFKVAELFLKEKKELKIIQLPKDDNCDKIDLKDYFKDHGKNDFIVLKDKAKTLIEKMIEGIDPKVSRQKMGQQLSPVLHLLALTDDITTNNYLNYLIKSTFGLKNQEISIYKNEIKRIKKCQQQDERKIKEDKKSVKGNDLKTVGQGQDFINDCLYYTIFDQELETFTDPESGEVKSRLVQIPYLVTSKREYTKANPEELLKRGFFFNKSLMPSVGLVNQWSTHSSVPYSIPDFISHNYEIDVPELYKKVKYYFDQYIVFPEKNIAVHLALAIMASYVLMVFDTIGYIHLHAEKRSGKTRALEIIEGLGYNAVMSSSISDAGLFRVIEATRCLLITDEAENLDPSAKAQAQNQSEKLQLLNAGYKRSGAAIRVENVNNNLTPVKYSTYSIKIFAGIKEINSVLRDRTITHLLKRVPGGVKHFVPSALQAEWLQLRNQLHVFGMTMASRISEIYRHELPIIHKDILERSNIVSREYEIWSPYLSIAKLIDEKSNGKTDTFADLLSIAGTSMRYKQQLEDDSYINRLLILINDFMNENDSSTTEGELKDYYNLTDMANFIKGNEGFEFVSASVLSKNMYGKFYLAKADEKKRIRRESQNIKDTYLRITKQSIADALERCGVKEAK
jgi:hypothetical protein